MTSVNVEQTMRLLGTTTQGDKLIIAAVIAAVAVVVAAGAVIVAVAVIVDD